MIIMVGGGARRTARFWRIAGALISAPGPWRVEQLRFELRRALRFEGRRWLCSTLLGCVERPARGDRPPALVANAHVHLWPPRLPPAALRRAEASWLRAEAEPFTARGWGVSWDPVSGRFGWVAHPLTTDLGPLVAERDFLEGTFGGAARTGAPPPPAPASMAGALEPFRGGEWIPSALVLARRGCPAPEVGGTIDVELRLLGPPAERRSSSRPHRAEAVLTLLLPEAARAELSRLRKQAWLRRLVASARGAGFRARWHLPPQGPSYLQLSARVDAGLASLRRQQRLLERLATGGLRG